MKIFIKEACRAVYWFLPVIILCVIPGMYLAGNPAIHKNHEAKIKPALRHENKVDVSGSAIWLFNPLACPLFDHSIPNQKRAI